jgi:SAM-dependent methyltransferase
MLFASELLCLGQLGGGLPQPWLEIGVGTGRFAEGLGIGIGVDPAAAVLRYARRRGIRTLRALGHALPFRDREFGAVVIIVTLCFASDAQRLLREAARVAKPEGGIVLGIVPAEGPWGRFYTRRARQGHTFYSEARFFTLEQLRELARVAGLRFECSVSTLFQSPGQRPLVIEHPYQGEDGRAGFVAMLFRPRPGPAPEGQDSEDEGPLFCMKDNTEIDPQDPHCPYPSSQCQFREWCLVREAIRSKAKQRRE